MKRIAIISLFLLIFFRVVVHVSAQNTGIGGGVGNQSNEANCDLCGYCKGQAAPSNWATCKACLYPGIADSSPESNGTLIGLPTPHPDHHYTTLGCLSTDPGQFASQVSTFFFSIVGGIAFLYLLYGAGIIATSRADSEHLNHGKRVVLGAVIGLLFVVFSVFIIRFLTTTLGIPGFGE